MDIDIKSDKVTMNFATFKELASARIEANNAIMEANNIKMENLQLKSMIKELLTQIVWYSDVDNNDFYKENAMLIPLFPDTDKVCKVSDTNV